MEVLDTKLSGVKLIKPKVFGDARGFFFEGFQSKRYQTTLGLEEPIVQINFSRSQYGVIRGLHYQLHKPQTKLVTVLRGRVFDVAVDIRRSSPTFGQWVGIELNEENHYQMYIPKGFAHGFSVLSEEADFCYACTDYYDPLDEKGILWSDEALGISWGVEAPVLSSKDRIYSLLKNLSPKDLFA